jgi:hypothetical protein
MVVGDPSRFTGAEHDLVDGLWPLSDKRKQALHDKIVNSLVVRTVPMPPGDPYRPL